MHKKEYCIGFTKKKTACKKLRTKNNLYCELHSGQNPPDNIEISNIKIPNIQPIISGDSIVPVKVNNTLGECCICIGNTYDFNDAKLKCGHHFHFKCITELRSPNCPLCRSKLESELINDNLIQIIQNRYDDDMKQRNSIAIEDFLTQELEFQDTLYGQEFQGTLYGQEFQNTLYGQNLERYYEELLDMLDDETINITTEQFITIATLLNDTLINGQLNPELTTIMNLILGLNRR